MKKSLPVQQRPNNIYLLFEVESINLQQKYKREYDTWLGSGIGMHYFNDNDCMYIVTVPYTQWAIAVYSVQSSNVRNIAMHFVKVIYQRLFMNVSHNLRVFIASCHFLPIASFQ